MASISILRLGLTETGDFDDGETRLSSRQDLGASCQSTVAVAKRLGFCPDDHVHEIAENNGNVADDPIGKQRAC
jgi:hypothetical protein